ncbi:hypothetical protein DSY14_28175, partial [Nocardiopsis sp. MG754419]|nr:hypothetical protein [Nocardiopsis sp. MG754419]
MTFSTYAGVCPEAGVDALGRARWCILAGGHEGDHRDDHGRVWPPAGVVLQGLIARWGRTHRIAWTGRLWMATDR